MAMNEKLVVPYAFTIVDGNPTSPNLANERLGRTATMSDITIIDLGSAQPVDTVALLATSAPTGQVFSVIGFTSIANARANTSPVAPGQNWPAWASAEASKRLHRQGVAMFAETVVARYWRIAVSTPFQCGRLVIGKAFTAADTMDIGYSFKVVDLGERRRATNSLVNNTLRGKVLEFSWVWSWMSEQEARGALLDLLAYAGTTRDILCILNPDAADLHNVIGYGSLIEEVEGVNVAGGNVDSAYEAKFRLQSRLLLNL